MHSYLPSPSRLIAILAALGLTLALLVGGLAPRTAPAAQAAPLDARNPLSIRWGFYVTYNPNSRASLDANVDKLNYVSPWFYTVNGDGILSNTVQPDVNALLARRGVHNLPMVRNTNGFANFHDALANPLKRGLMIDSLLAAVQANNYDGITIDFEAISADDGPFLTLFMQELYTSFHASNKQVAMAVPPKTRDIRTGWAGAYTYRDLNPWADLFIIMAYDQHFPGGAPGPVAPLPWWKDVLAYTQQTMTIKKIVMGTGLYGYDWNKTTGAQAEARTWGEVQNLGNTYGGQFLYSGTDAAPQLFYYKDGQNHEVWYENRQSFDAKIAALQASPVAGFALWRLGQEDPEVWNSLVALRSPCAPVPPFASTNSIWYVRETGHSLQGAFLRYWNRYGGAALFGYPLTEEFLEYNPADGRTYTVQYFERNRFEYHPENAGSPHEVLLGLLGVQYLDGRFFPLSDQRNNSNTVTYFPQTGHSIGGGFRTFWQQRGGLGIFGYPLTEEFLERNPDDGNFYTVQYFQRARFEWHPERSGTPFEFQLGRLGAWALDQRGCQP